MYGDQEFQGINAAIWSTTSMLLDDCEQVVAQLRGVRELLEAEREADDGIDVSTQPPTKRRREADEPSLPPLPSATRQPSTLYRQASSNPSAVKRIKVLSPNEASKRNCSTPLKTLRQEALHQTVTFDDPFRSPATRRRPQVTISSESD